MEIIYILKLKKLVLAVGYLDYPLMAKEETWGFILDLRLRDNKTLFEDAIIFFRVFPYIFH